MILLDTNFIVYYLHKVEPYATKIKGILLHEADLAISLRVLDEILFTSTSYGSLEETRYKETERTT